MVAKLVMVFFANCVKCMSYDDTSHDERENFLKSRLDVLLKPAVGILSGKNAPSYLRNDNQLEAVTGTALDKLLKDHGIPWKRDDIAKRLEDERRQFSLNKIVYSSAEAPIDLDALSISNNKSVLAASLFADVSGFTHYIDAARNARERRRALRVFHAIRKEMALVIKDDIQGLRIQYQGDRVQGLFHLPKDNEAAIAEKAVKAAIGLQSSMQQTLKACLPEMRELQLKVGIDLGINLVS